jgi:hypothetical protein
MFSIIIAFAVSSTMYTKMKQNWFISALWMLILSALFAGFFSASTWTDVFAQDPTPESGDVYITVTYAEPINVRNGPSTVLYDIIGSMQPGETAQALGVSPGRDWVQIVYPAAPAGVAWVYTSLITLSAGNLQIVEPPPTAAPRITATIDPTLAAAYVFEPTATRMPTFTPPPPLEITKFTQGPTVAKPTGVPMGAFVLGSAILGVLGFLVSLWRRR